MSNKKGFTLVELLAVIVILGVIISIVTMSVLGTKNKANIEEAKKIEEQIKLLGSEVYLDKRETKIYQLDDLKEYGLKTPIKNPSGKGICTGYLEITTDADFKAYINCPGVYTTDGYEATNDESNSDDNNILDDDSDIEEESDDWIDE